MVPWIGDRSWEAAKLASRWARSSTGCVVGVGAVGRDATICPEKRAHPDRVVPPWSVEVVRWLRRCDGWMSDSSVAPFVSAIVFTGRGCTVCGRLDALRASFIRHADMRRSLSGFLFSCCFFLLFFYFFFAFFDFTPVRIARPNLFKQLIYICVELGGKIIQITPIWIILMLNFCNFNERHV